MSTLTLDPELRGVLEDVVKQSPDSSVFTGFTPTRFQKTFTLPDQTISIARAGLSTAERELVSVHREKLAALFRQAFFVSFMAGGGRDWMASGWQAPTAEVFSRKASAVQRSSPAEAYRYRSGHYLRRLVVGDAVFDDDDLSSMLIASLRLSDHTSGRLYHVYLDTKREAYPAAWRTLAPLLDSGDPGVSCFARKAWIKCLEERGETAKAAAWGEDALRFAFAHDQDDHVQTLLAQNCFRHLRGSSAPSEITLDHSRISPGVVHLIRSYASDPWAQAHLSSTVRDRILRACES